jgi:beta-xylosidase
MLMEWHPSRGEMVMATAKQGIKMRMAPNGPICSWSDQLPRRGIFVGLAAVFSAALALALPASARYRNPVLFADYSDPDVVKAGRDYFMVASSFQAVPGLPILQSRDLVSWTLIGHAVDRLPGPGFDRPQHGKGLWAPSIRFHDGLFWIYVGDPDRGIFATRARDPRGPWEPLRLVHAARGWIDPCPFWDDDGRAYLVHAFARSRAGFNGLLMVNRLSADGLRVTDPGTVVFDGRRDHPTIEGPKFYKRDGWYYVFAPAGGVKTGWQTVLRSRHVLGPYEARIVMDQGASATNGPHQGAWVEGARGDSWFLHFQDREAYGRIVHLQPLAWREGWPVIGEDRDGDGRGQPVAEWPRPEGLEAEPPPALPHDEFDGPGLARDWQWQANPRPEWSTLGAPPGALRLFALAPETPRPNLWPAPHLLLQKLPAPAFTATAALDAGGLQVGQRAGLLLFGLDYAGLIVERTPEGLLARRVTAREASRGGAETVEAARPLPAGAVQLRLTVEPEAVGRFSLGAGGGSFEPLGPAFTARPGLWVGAKVGLFAEGRSGDAAGHADFDWFRIERQ